MEQMGLGHMVVMGSLITSSLDHMVTVVSLINSLEAFVPIQKCQLVAALVDNPQLDMD